MGVRIPRITLKADYGDKQSFGDLSLLSIGYGLHQAWIFAVMFGSSSIFGTQVYVSGMYGSHASLAFLVSIVIYSICLLFAAATDQRFLPVYVSKKTLTAGALLASAGTGLLLIPIAGHPAILEIISGIMTGMGSATLILFWGVAYARCDSSSIVLNSAIAIPIGIGIYAICLHFGPYPLAGIFTAIIPLLELLILRKKTPRSFLARNEIPIFKPLPINHTRFLLKFGAPVVVFGLALGMLRQTSIQYVVPASTLSDQVILLVAACGATILILITILAINGSGKWSHYFRPLVPFIAVALFFLPLSGSGDTIFSSLFLIIGYLCFEALMWIFFGELSQNFRLSPIFVFGLGRGLLAISSLAGSLFPIVAANWIGVLPFGEQGMVTIVMLVMVVAYVLLPREHEIEAIVIPCPLVKAVSRELDEGVRPFGRLTAECTPSDSPQAEPSHPEGPGSDGRPHTGIDSTDRTRQGERAVSDSDTSSFIQPMNSEDTPSDAPLGQRHASFSSTLAQPGQMDESKRRKQGYFYAKIETIANTYLLSRRETEIMFFLAKGHNAAYIQEKLYISEGTAKTHIRHIYRKTNVHSQQELMRLVESAGSDR